MNRRTTLMLTGMAALGVAIAALPEFVFAQADPLLGLWQLNVAKSKFSPGPAPRSQTLFVYAEGQNRKVTVVTIDAAGNPGVVVIPQYIEDGQPYPVTATPAISYDANAITRVDAYTVNFSRTKVGRVVQAGTRVLSQDGKTLTFTTTGTDANGRQINNVAVYDKQ